MNLLLLNVYIVFWLTYPIRSTIINQDFVSYTKLSLSESPYFVTTSVNILKNVKVEIEPGVVIKLYPKVKIGVSGALIAVGTADKRIVFTKANSSNDQLFEPNVRLVDGEEFREGKVNIRVNGIWRPVCSQNREWTNHDIHVTCKEMGFLRGNFSLNGLAENDTSHLMLMQPNCTGKENRLSDCSGFPSYVIGSAVCNLQDLVGLHCWGARDSIFSDNWWGLTFYNSTLEEISDKNTRLNVSYSKLTFVDLLYGGVNWTNHRVSVLSASPYPPRITNVRFSFNAYDALNFTEIRGPAIVKDSLFERNYGHGMNITSSVGYVFLSNVTARQNSGAGGYIRITSKHWAEETPEIIDQSKSICGDGAISSAQIFPFLVLTEHPVPIYKAEDICYLPIRSDRQNQVISVKLLEAIRDPTASAVITITDSTTNRNLAIWNFTDMNTDSVYSSLDKLFYGPLYQGVSSTSQTINIFFHWKKSFSQDVCSYLRQCFRGILQISVGETTNPEVVVRHSLFEKNVQHGLRIENLGLYAQILHSTFQSNEYGAGLHLINGSFDVLVHDCLFKDNFRAGLNITTAGGTRIVNASTFTHNDGHGLDIWNPTWLMSRVNSAPINNIVFLSTFNDNIWNGIRFYNSTWRMNILVNYSSFIGNRKNGIEMVATIQNQHQMVTNFSVGFSVFTKNLWHGIMISPIGQMTGQIFNSSFNLHHNGGAIYIDNGVNFDEQRILYHSLQIFYNISYNKFFNNSGPFVLNVRLTQTSFLQRCFVMYNYFYDNKVVSTTTKLNPRSYASAVVVLGSSNVFFNRNFMQNPKSKYEIASQLQAADNTIDASMNFWGTLTDINVQSWDKVHEFVFGRIFDHFSRYSLATVEYFPVLKEAYLLSKILSDTDPRYRPLFRKGSIIGGVIDINLYQNIRLEYQSDPYIVTRDIFVPQGAALNVDSGVQLQFENSVGVFVQGSINLGGIYQKKIMMTLKQQDPVDLIGRDVQLVTMFQANYSQYNLTQINSTIFENGTNILQGLVRVRVNQTWGLICGNRFDMLIARIICAEFGLVVHPSDWILTEKEKMKNIFNDTIIMSTLRCQTWETRLSQCEFDNQFEHNCSDSPINVKCYRPGWSGVQITLTNEQSVLTELSVKNAGLVDYYVSQFEPAVKIDYNKHKIYNISISHCLSDGLMIRHNDVLGRGQISFLKSFNNVGSGVIVKTPWITFDNCRFENNKFSGFSFDSMFTEQELFEYRSAMLKTKNMLENPVNGVTMLQIYPTGLDVLFMNPGHSNEKTTYWVQITSTDENKQQQLLVTLIDFNSNCTEENVTIFDNTYAQVMTQLKDPTFGSSITWSIPKDLTRFPILSNGLALTIKIVVNGVRSGRLAFLVQSRSFIDLWNNNMLSSDTTTASGQMFYPTTYLKITNSTTKQNQVGVSIIHYNSGTDSQNRSYTIRQSRLNITLSNIVFFNNSKSAINVPSVSPYAQDFYYPTYGDDSSIESNARISIINYRIVNNSATENGAVMISEHNHVPFAGNIWHYFVEHNWFSSNNGGFTIQMPFVSKKFDWRYIPNVDHVFNMSKNYFVGNRNFQFLFDGYYTIVNVKQNNISDNVCSEQGLMSFTGMEKLLNVSENLITWNRFCPFLIEIMSDSQTEFATPVIGSINHNKLTNNSCLMVNPVLIDNSISCFAVGVFGNQNVTVNRNILSNQNQFKYEIVGGVISNTLNSKFDARENYWGTVSIDGIRSLIFDVNNWNNFAEVVFERFLLSEDLFTVNVYPLPIAPISFDMAKYLGGRISQNLFLPYRSTPYVVLTDLTVLPGVEFRIDSGVTLEFAPNIGILVLGKLTARGTSRRPIVMKPYQDPNVNVVIRARRSVTPQNKIKFIGGNAPNEGFVQFFNDTAQRWDYICDDQFSREVAQVVCRQMGFKANNPVVRRSYLLDYQLYGYDNYFVLKYIWTIRYTCRGYEPTVDRCIQRLNYDYYRCLVNRDFVFMRCNDDFLEKNESFWGNIRIVLPGLEQKGSPNEADRSYLEYINITKAGVLHGEFVSAVQTTYAFVHVNYLNIEKCALNGIDIIAPRLFVHVTNSTLKYNAGYGVGFTLLNKDPTDPLTSTKTVLPMLLSPLPSSIFGLMDMCGIQKDIQLTDRQIIYYRYSYQTIACTKLIRSTVPNKRIAIRFMQLNLYYDPFTKNTIEFYNGDAFNLTETLMFINAKPKTNGVHHGFDMTISMTSLITSPGYDILGIQLHASPASEKHGFIMELVTVPISPDYSYADIDRYTEYLISESNFHDNRAGGVQTSAVGRDTPRINIYYNRFINNGDAPMLNLTANPLCLVRIQNRPEVNVANNYFYNNRGGLELHLYSDDSRATKTNFTNNVLINTTLGTVLMMIGNYISTVMVQRNYIADNNCEYRDLIKVDGLLMKSFAYNFITNNRASVMINASGLNDLSTYSQYFWNGFYNNIAINYTRRTTIFSYNSKNQFSFNYFRNILNDYELTVGNRSIMKESPILSGNRCPEPRECPTVWTIMFERNSCVCYRTDTLDARQNWWGDGNEFYIKGRIWDASDDKYLVPVDHSSFYKDNLTVLGNGQYCPPTWTFYDNNCFFYFGAPLDYFEVIDFCQSKANAIIANSRDRVEWLGKFMELWQNNYQWLNLYTFSSRIWIHSYVPFTGFCPAVRNKWLEGFQCYKKIPFVCQKAPLGVYKGVQMELVIALILIVIILLLIIPLFILLWIRHSKQRSKAFLVRCDNLKHKFAEENMVSLPYNIGYSKLAMTDVTSTKNSSHLLSKTSIPVGTMKSTLSASSRSKYDDDVMKMRRNTLTDTREILQRPKSVSEVDSYNPRVTNAVPATQMVNPRKSYKNRHGKYNPKQSTLDSHLSGVSSEALYFNVKPGSEMKLSQPDVPQLFRSPNSKSSINLMPNYDLDPSRMSSMVDPLLDPSVASRNRPLIMRSTVDIPNSSTIDSFNSSSRDTAALFSASQRRRSDERSPQRAHRKPKHHLPSTSSSEGTEI